MCVCTWPRDSAGSHLGECVCVCVCTWPRDLAGSHLGVCVCVCVCVEGWEEGLETLSPYGGSNDHWGWPGELSREGQLPFGPNLLLLFILCSPNTHHTPSLLMVVLKASSCSQPSLAPEASTSPLPQGTQKDCEASPPQHHRE